MSECSPKKSTDDPLLGYWVLEAPDPDDIMNVIFEIKKDSAGRYVGNSHVFYLGAKYTTDTLLNLRYKDNKISMVSDPAENQRFSGMYNNRLNRIEGFPTGEDGSTLKHNLKKLEDKYLEGSGPVMQESEPFIYNYHPPVLPLDGVVLSDLGREGMDPDKVGSLIRKIADQTVGEVHAVLIAKNDKLVLEEYFYGHGMNSLHPLHSSTKSIASLLFGMAAGTAALDDCIWTYLKEYDSHRNDSNRAITVEQLLTMTAGFEVGDHLWDGAKDLYENALTRKMALAPGEAFQYDGGCSNMLGKIIHCRSGVKADEFAEQALFEPLNITDYYWQKDHEGKFPVMDGGLALTARDMLKIGILVKNKGKWNGKQVIPESWIEESTRLHVEETGWGTEGYGYHWWIEKPNEMNGRQQIVYSQGMGFQVIMIIPASGMVMVVTAGNYRGMEKNFELWKAIHALI
ncbi:MAG: beta-lactamase family protein [Cytophagales bacterium]|nr:beta-lactamase family protein [Cytophagales bacterium]